MNRLRWAVLWVCVPAIATACAFSGDAGVGDDALRDAWDNIQDDDAADDDLDMGPYADLAPVGPVLGETFGLASQMSGAAEDAWKREFEAKTLEAINVKKIRVGFSWADVEPRNDTWEWSRTDALLDAALAHGLEWNARLAYRTDWAAPGGSPSEIDPGDFADYAAHVAARYCGDIPRYEIWNEPNLYHFWEPEPDPAHYGELLKAAYTAVKGECEEAEVLFGGLSSNNFPQEFFFNTYPFFDQVAAAHPDVCEYFDAMPIHPYTILQMAAPERRAEALGIVAPDLPGQVDDIRARMAAAGCGEKPVLFTEFGYPSTYIGDDTQAAFSVRTVLLGATRQVTGYYLYTFWDKIDREPPTENDFGMFEFPATDDDAQVPKTAFFAYRTLVELLASTRYAGDLREAIGLPRDVYALAFVDDAGRLIVAVWRARRGGDAPMVAIPVPPGATAARVIDMSGDVADADLSGDIEVEASPYVRYVEFTLAKTWW